ncbi:MAG TPA: hypothetical protein PLL75_07465 [Candidatus Omnitrophota bacterium]|nr:hypothetical protein [Candidatus Omnitrophota bacterium]HPS37544.1 hypothetical protein [Candidatus Omnitrophota bacterium]
MKKRTNVGFAILGILTILVLGIVLHFSIIARAAATEILNRSAKDFFDHSIRIRKVTLDPHFKLHIFGITGNFKAKQGPVPVEIRFLESLDPLYFLLGSRPVRFVFAGVRPKGSVHGGVLGHCVVRGGKNWRIEFTADLGRTDLSDFVWLDPSNLGGATGAVKGTLHVEQAAGGDPVVEMTVEAPEPGGEIQAKFFDLFLPYLPPSVQKERVLKLTGGKEQLVRYQTAGLEVRLPRTDRMKVLLRILVLDYNLKLTLNADIRTDQRDAFSQIAQLLGLIEVKTS